MNLDKNLSMKGIMVNAGYSIPNKLQATERLLNTPVISCHMVEVNTNLQYHGRECYDLSLLP